MHGSVRKHLCFIVDLAVVQATADALRCTVISPSKQSNLCCCFALTCRPLLTCSSRNWRRRCGADLWLPRCTYGERPPTSAAFENADLAITGFTGCFRRSQMSFFRSCTFRPIVFATVPFSGHKTRQFSREWWAPVHPFFASPSTLSGDNRSGN